MPQQLRYFLQNIQCGTRIILILDGKVVLQESAIEKIPYVDLIDYQDYMVKEYCVDRGAIVFSLAHLGYSRRVR